MVLWRSNFFLVNLRPECPNRYPSMSPKHAPTAATIATRMGEYKFPPAITVKNAGAETKKVALETKFTINKPNNPKDEACLKKSLYSKKTSDNEIDKRNTDAAYSLFFTVFSS